MQYIVISLEQPQIKQDRGIQSEWRRHIKGQELPCSTLARIGFPAYLESEGAAQSDYSSITLQLRILKANEQIYEKIRVKIL